LVDTVAVILITWWLGGLDGMMSEETNTAALLMTLIATGYVFKFAFALLDTIPFYCLVRWLSRYLEIDPVAEYRHDTQ
jgi:uncharacterized PurR-regulated membrane protein YhhQ (DUF165 family)